MHVSVVQWSHPIAEANCNVAGPTVRMTLPDISAACLITVEVTSRNSPDRDSSYWAVYRPAEKPSQPSIPGNPDGVTILNIGARGSIPHRF
jgi:hypothetical protein